MKNFLLLAFSFIALSSSVWAQNNESSSLFDTQETVSVEDHYFRITILPLGGEYEAKIGRHETFIAKAFLSGSYTFTSDTYEGTSSSLAVFPSFSSGIRHYYNLDKRAAQGKFISGNSGNYVSGLATLTLPPVYMSENLEYIGGMMYSIGGVWGMQRSYPGGFSLNLGIGLGLTGNQEVSTFGLIGELGLGFHIKN